MSMNVARKAEHVASIFNVLAWVVGFFGGAIAFVMLVSGLGRGADFRFFAGAAIIVALNTAVCWALISLCTVVAGYIAAKAPAPPATPVPNGWDYPPQNNPANYPQHYQR